MFTKPKRSGGPVVELCDEPAEEALPEECPEQPTTNAKQAAVARTAPITDLRVTRCLLADRDRPRVPLTPASLPVPLCPPAPPPLREALDQASHDLGILVGPDGDRELQ